MVRVLIVENSHIVSLGLMSLIRTFQDIEDVRLVDNEKDCCKIAHDFEPDLIVVNTSVLNHESMIKVMDVKKAEAIVMHVFNSSLPLGSPANHLSILDSKEVLSDKFEKVIENLTRLRKEIETEELSPREKDILKEVALGLTNKEIAEKMYISTHTVISHRKNITRKLGIKTVSGLTVYAILNNIIQMDDVS
ncbi:response regulator transcription factor [Carboxylicivirga sp. A043]|uniref:response regulator transcription factor n=1 Tax=Carboxylicivirga litoralis TaxID=2816963 RepID=UPI0021CB6A3C|nr:response regulator transcription factor [Carboxylicivirga sp. A043]MCU4158247.1 response regulator transcription factor [Carboxylicivirga sp. A043]